MLSDHADWEGLREAIKATGAENIWVTHGYTAPLARWLSETGLRAEAIETHYQEELEESEQPES